VKLLVKSSRHVTFIAPIFYFFEIGNPIESPFQEPFMRISSHAAQNENRQILFSTDILDGWIQRVTAEVQSAMTVLEDTYDL